MRLRDNSGGIFTELLVKKKSPEVVLRQSFYPSPRMMTMVGQELIRSIRGDHSNKIMVRVRNGRLIPYMVANGQYPYGLLKEKSPDGTDYIPLEKATKNVRKYEKGISHDRILMETGKHLYSGLKIIKQTSGARGRQEVIIGWTGEDAEIALIQHNGDPDNYIEFRGQEYDAPIPPRPFIGIQQKFKLMFAKMYRNYFR